MSPHALVVGGTIHARLTRRERLRAEGFHVTLERSTHRGLQRLSQHPYAVCSLDLTDVQQPRAWQQRYRHASSVQGTQLRTSDWPAEPRPSPSGVATR